jgi:hypothetical protein
MAQQKRNAAEADPLERRVVGEEAPRFAGAIVANSADYSRLAQVLFWLAFTMFVAGGILEIRGKRLRD